MRTPYTVKPGKLIQLKSFLETGCLRSFEFGNLIKLSSIQLKSFEKTGCLKPFELNNRVITTCVFCFMLTSILIYVHFYHLSDYYSALQLYYSIYLRTQIALNYLRYSNSQKLFSRRHWSMTLFYWNYFCNMSFVNICSIKLPYTWKAS